MNSKPHKEEREPNPTAWAITAALILCTAGCGSGGDESPTLFEGPPGSLVPHEVGRTTHFLVRTSHDGQETRARLTSRVLQEGPGGEFIVENSFDDGRLRRLRVRETEDTIRVEAFARAEPEGFSWTVLPRPAIVAQTPVVVGQARQHFFSRLLDVESRTPGDREPTSLAIEGVSTRTALPMEFLPFGSVEVPVIPFEIESSSRLSGFIPGFPDDLALELRGIEYLSPGLGLVRENLELTIRGGASEMRLSIHTERMPPPGDPAGS